MVAASGDWHETSSIRGGGMSIEKISDFTSIRCVCGITFNFKAPGSKHCLAEIEAENARLKEALSTIQSRPGKSQAFAIVKSDYEKLRKLDENVKREIKRLKILPILTNPEERILLTLESLYE